MYTMGNLDQDGLRGTHVVLGAEKPKTDSADVAAAARLRASNSIVAGMIAEFSAAQTTALDLALNDQGETMALARAKEPEAIRSAAKTLALKVVQVEAEN